MKVSREQAEQNRERVIDLAAQLFRERGFEGIGVADLMKSAGLTHGAFYGQFDSKEALMAEACKRAFDRSTDAWQRMLQQRRQREQALSLADVARSYLSPGHRDRPGAGCVMVALGGEAARQGPSVRQALARGLERFVELLADIAPGADEAARRERALAAFAAMAGALLVARAVDDEALSQEVLQATLKRLVADLQA